jgi:hypothetical protein
MEDVMCDALGPCAVKVSITRLSLPVCLYLSVSTVCLYYAPAGSISRTAGTCSMET